MRRNVGARRYRFFAPASVDSGAALDGVVCNGAVVLLLNALERRHVAGPAGITSEVTKVVEQ
jgi:hypothetical protein